MERRIFKSRIASDLRRRSYSTTNHDLFASRGSPWITADTWRREAQLSQNPRANTQLRRSAAAYTERHRNQPLPSREVPEPRPIPQTVDRAEQARRRSSWAAVQRELNRLMAPGGDQSPREKYYVHVPSGVYPREPDPVQIRKHMLIERARMGLTMSLDHWCEIFNLFGSHAAFVSACR